MIINRRIHLLVTVTLLTSATLANTGPSFRPAARPAASPTVSTIGQNSGTVAPARIEALKSQLQNNKALKGLPKGVTDKLVAAYFTNGTYKRTVNESLRVTGILNDPLLFELEHLRLELLSMVNIDLYDPNIQNSLLDRNQHSHYLIAKIIHKLDGTSLSAEGKRKVLELFNEFKMQLSNLPIENASQILENALDGFNNDTGFGLDANTLEFAAKSDEGLASLFAGQNDPIDFKVGQFEGNELVIKMSQRQLEDLATISVAQFTKLKEIAQGRNQAQMLDQTAQVVQSQKISRADAFIQGNKLLDAPEVAVQASKTVNAKAAESYDELLRDLREWGSIIDGNKAAGMTERFMKDGFGRLLPGSGWIAKKAGNINDQELKKASLKKKIEITRGALRTGNNTIREHNQSLNQLRAQAVDYALELEKDMVRLKLLSDQIRRFILDIQESQPELAANMKIRVGLRVEKELESVVTLSRVLNMSGQQIEIIIMTGMNMVMEGELLEQRMIPILTLTESAKVATAAQDAQLKRIESGQKFTIQRMEKLVEETERATQKNIELAGKSFIPPEKLKEWEERLAQAQISYNQGIQRAYDMRSAGNDQLIKGYSNSRRNGVSSADAVQVDGILNGKK